MNFHIIETIRQAARARKVLRIIYIRKNDASEGWRYIEPYSFSNDDKDQGLFAWDRSKDSIRRFSIERIEQAELTEENFIPRYEVKIL